VSAPLRQVLATMMCSMRAEPRDGASALFCLLAHRMQRGGYGTLGRVLCAGLASRPLDARLRGPRLLDMPLRGMRVRPAGAPLDDRKNT